MKRTKHSLSHYVLSTFDMGQLVPVGNYEVIPGDSVRQSTSCLIRVSPLMTPVMHPVSVRLHHWFVPYRLLMDESEDGKWEDFITGGADGQGMGAEIPTLSLGGGAAAKGLADYFGIPPNVAAAGVEVNAFAFRAYNLIYNEYYRDQDLQTEVAEDSGFVQNIAWEKDSFTAARPWTQKGPEVTLPIGVNAPLYTTAGDGGNILFNAGIEPQPNVRVVTSQTAGSPATWGGAGAGAANVYADLSAATGIPINDVRLAFAVQRYQEARAQYGSRYTEYLRYLGVRSSDARLQRPEYLGGGRATISFSEVLKTGEGDTPAEDSPVGEMRGHGISAMRSRRFIRFFEEHGIVMTLASIRPRTMYMDGLQRQWSRRTKEDFWQKELELVGQQAIPAKEVYLGAAVPDGEWGFQDRYYEYRHQPSYVAGEFRTTLNDWHLARSFGSEPALNEDFIKCVPSKRIHAEQTTNTIWGMFSHSIQARRMVGNRTIGRII